MKKLACLAYMRPTEADPAEIARYSMAIVNIHAARRKEYVAWLGEIRKINPTIRILNYVQVATQDLNPTESGEALMQAHPLAWLPDLTYAATDRLFADYRSAAWKDAFLNACEAGYRAFPLDGLFLDNCSVWLTHVRHYEDGPAMTDALQATLRELRRRHPASILIGNSNQKWAHLNGEMLETSAYQTITARGRELMANHCHVLPECNLLAVRTDDPGEAAAALVHARTYGAWFAAQPTWARLRWFPCFDEMAG